MRPVYRLNSRYTCEPLCPLVCQALRTPANGPGKRVELQAGPILCRPHPTQCDGSHRMSVANIPLTASRLCPSAMGCATLICSAFCSAITVDSCVGHYSGGGAKARRVEGVICWKEARCRKLSARLSLTSTSTHSHRGAVRDGCAGKVIPIENSLLASTSNSKTKAGSMTAMKARLWKRLIRCGRACNRHCPLSYRHWNLHQPATDKVQKSVAIYCRGLGQLSGSG